MEKPIFNWLVNAFALTLFCLFMGCNTGDATQGNDSDEDPRVGQARESVEADPKKPSPPSATQNSVLNSVRSDERKRAIVFVHGIFGDSDASWLNEVSGRRFPELLAESGTFDDCDIYTYGYFSPSLAKANSIDQIAESLRLRLDHEKVVQGHEDIIFVSHSMGGLIVRAYLLKYRETISKTKLMYFYSTPAGGATITSLAKVASNNPQVRDMLPIVDNTFLQSQDNAWAAEPHTRDIASYAAYETVPTYGVRVVDELSAKRLANRRSDPLPFNHFDICKPELATDDRFIVFEQAYRETFGDIDSKELELTSENLPTLRHRLEDEADLLSIAIRTPLQLPQEEEATGWIVGNLEISGHGQILIGQSDLSLDVRGWLRVDEGEPNIVVSFGTDDLVASSGQDGEHGANAAAPNPGGKDGANGVDGDHGKPGKPGLNGKSSGNLMLKLKQSPSNPFAVSLVGQDGGKGGNGGNGGDGSNGANGKDVEIAGDGVTARSGAGNGGHGGKGGNGGAAGLGGVAGNGGVVTLDVPETIRDKVGRMIRIDTRIARHGQTGQPGQKGQGGTAGTGGAGARLEGGIGQLFGRPITHDAGENGKRGDDGVEGTSPESNFRAPQKPQLNWKYSK